jgi:hypothetical protein
MARRFKRPIRRSPKCDPQRQRFYRMEHEAINGRRLLNTLTQPQVRKLVKVLSRSYKIPGPLVQFVQTDEFHGMWVDPNLLLFNTKSGPVGVVTVVHEMAHYVHEVYAPDNEDQPHGPQFVACYMSIIDALRLVPVCGMRAILEDYKLKYIDPGKNTTLTTLKRRLKRRVK